MIPEPHAICESLENRIAKANRHDDALKKVDKIVDRIRSSARKNPYIMKI